MQKMETETDQWKNVEKFKDIFGDEYHELKEQEKLTIGKAGYQTANVVIEQIDEPGEEECNS